MAKNRKQNGIIKLTCNRSLRARLRSEVSRELTSTISFHSTYSVKTKRLVSEIRNRMKSR